MLPRVAQFVLFFSVSATPASVPQPSLGTTPFDDRLFTLSESTTGTNPFASQANVSFVIGADLVISSNTSTMEALNLDTPSTNVISVRCDPTKPVNFLSCRGAMTYSAINDEQTRFAERHAGIARDVPLPYRITGNDGRCYIEPVLIAGATSGQASFTNVSRAASAILQGCVIPRGLGGTAMNIGGDNNLNILMAPYDPRVRCNILRPGPPWESCGNIFFDMHAETERKVFGSPGPRVEVTLPFRLQSTDARCAVDIIATGQSTTSSWYEIWAAMYATAAMCTRKGNRGGKFGGIGLRKTISLVLYDEHPDLVGLETLDNGSNASLVADTS